MQSRLPLMMRYVPHLRLLALTLVVLLFALTPARAVMGPALVFDAETGEVLIEERAGEPWYPASLTKLMTGYLVFEALESGKLRLDQLIPVSEAAAALPASKLGVPAGLNVRVELALKSILIHSANDMAHVLAEAVSGSAADFVAEMNATARRLDMHSTSFANPHGLPDPRQITTARDMGVLAAAFATRFPQAREYYAAPHFMVGEVELRNRNGLLRQMEAADGMKTGFICDSGFNLVASATIDGRRLISVVMGAKSAPSRNVLSQVLLESAAVLANDPIPPRRPVLADLANLPVGPSGPFSLNEMVCQGVGLVTLQQPDEPMNWGVSLGRYAAPLTAEAILTGRLLATGDAAASRPSGVVLDPGREEYLALVWNMSKRDTLAFCARLQRHNAPCEVQSPKTFADMARQFSRTADTSVDPVEQKGEGSH
jgi:D-alanyl-D-alanine carboxypeptidase